jgi:dienelactone hydrolase
LVCGLGVLLILTLNVKGQAPWNVKQLEISPAFRWLNTDTAKVRTLVYQGLPFGNLKATSVFAYYATPGTLSGHPQNDKKLPLMVLIHGGGGKAYKEWVILWAKRGYAAIAMDLAGKDENGQRLPDGGPNQDDIAKYRTIDSSLNTQWVYHSVANVLLAHSLALSFKEVDPQRTAITGISWGGYLTCIVAGLDNRFKAAIPVYGCGFLGEPGGYFYERVLSKMKAGSGDKWFSMYDPSHYIAMAKMPFLWVGGANDQFYQAWSVAKTYNLVNKQSVFRLLPDMPHGQGSGSRPAEIQVFADHYLMDKPALPVVNSISINNNVVIAQVTTNHKITAAKLYYTKDALNATNKVWQTVIAVIENDTVKAAAPPQGTTLWLINIQDDKGSTVSTAYQFSSEVN